MITPRIWYPSSQVLLPGEIIPCICVSTSTHVNVMSCHMCTQTTWRSELEFYKKFQLCEREAGISMQSVLWFSQQYHYNSLFTGHVLTSTAIFWLPLQRCATNSITTAVLLTAHPPAVLLTAHPPDTNTKVFDPKQLTLKNLK